MASLKFTVLSLFMSVFGFQLGSPGLEVKAAPRRMASLKFTTLSAFMSPGITTTTKPSMKVLSSVSVSPRTGQA